jgi:hypothetical protein
LSSITIYLVFPWLFLYCVSSVRDLYLTASVCPLLSLANSFSPFLLWHSLWRGRFVFTRYRVISTLISLHYFLQCIKRHILGDTSDLLCINFGFITLWYRQIVRKQFWLLCTNRTISLVLIHILPIQFYSYFTNTVKYYLKQTFYNYYKCESRSWVI